MYLMGSLIKLLQPNLLNMSMNLFWIPTHQSRKTLLTLCHIVHIAANTLRIIILRIKKLQCMSQFLDKIHSIDLKINLSKIVILKLILDLIAVFLIHQNLDHPLLFYLKKKQNRGHFIRYLKTPYLIIYRILMRIEYM